MGDGWCGLDDGEALVPAPGMQLDAPAYPLIPVAAASPAIPGQAQARPPVSRWLAACLVLTRQQALPRPGASPPAPPNVFFLHLAVQAASSPSPQLVISDLQRRVFDEACSGAPDIALVMHCARRARQATPACAQR